MDDTGYSILPPNRTFQRTARKRASAENIILPEIEENFKLNISE